MGNENSTDILYSDGKKIVWYWQSNKDQDPWEVPEDRREWTSYQDEQTIILEKAYLDKKEVADLGEYCVMIPKMVQYKKDDTHQQRRVMRKEIDEPVREDRFSDEPSKPKSINNPFGTLNDFKIFLMTISRECRVFQGLELGGNAQLFFMFKKGNFEREKERIGKERKELEKTLSNGILNEGKILGKNQEAMEFSKQIAETIKNAPAHETNPKIYKQLMKMYTQQKFLYKRVNDLLRGENWKELFNLAPYIFYLTKAFEAKILAPTPEDIKTWGCLYRGMTLPKESLSFYDPNKTKYFSWYAFTSTSKNLAVAEKFKSKVPPGEIKVLFTFDISDCCPSQLAAVSEISAFKEEEEVIIAPATLYEIISTELKDEKYYIQVKVLPPNDLKAKVEQKDITVDGLRAKNLQELEACVKNKQKSFDISYQNDHNIRDAIEILSKAQKVEILLIKESTFEKFGVAGLFEMLQNKNVQSLFFNYTTIKNEAAAWLPKESFKDLRHLNITASALEDQVFAKLFNSLSGKSLRALSFCCLAFFPGELKPLTSLKNPTNIMYLEFTACEFTPDNLQDLEQALPLMQLQRLIFLCEKGGDILQTLSRILPKMSTLKELNFEADVIKKEAYHEFVKCLPETNLESLTLYGDVDEEQGSLIADALAKSKVLEVCLSSSQMPEEKLLEMVLSRVTMNICVSVYFFSDEKNNNFNRIIELLCKYKVFSLKFQTKEVRSRLIFDIISKLPETHLRSLHLPERIKTDDQPLQKFFEYSDYGNFEIKRMIEALEKVLGGSQLKEICLPEYTSYLSIDVYFFLRKFKIKKIDRDEFLKRLLK